MKFTVFVSLALALCAIVSAQMEDLRLTEGATGAAVVHAVVDTIQESGIFSDDNKLLRRIAYVATQDGEAKSVNSRGRFGMWQLQADAFVETWTNMNIQSQRDAILETFGIDWLLVVPKDLSIPLYGGLAARLFLATISEPIPAQENIEGQASYWKSYYGTARQDGTPTEFTVEVFRLEQIERKPAVNGINVLYTYRLHLGCKLYTSYKGVIERSTAVLQCTNLAGLLGLLCHHRMYLLMDFSITSV